MSMEVILRQSMSGDGILDRGDLEMIGVSIPAMQYSAEGIEAMNIVLDEMLRGVFQIPSCFRVSDQVMEDLKNLASHGFRGDLAERLEKYRLAPQCLQTPFDPGVIDTMPAEIEKAVIIFEENYAIYERSVKAWQSQHHDVLDQLHEGTDAHYLDGGLNYEQARQRIDMIRSKIREQMELAERAFDQDSVARLKSLLELLPTKVLPSYSSLYIDAREKALVSALQGLWENAEQVAGGKARVADANEELGALLKRHHRAWGFDLFDSDSNGGDQVIFLDGFSSKVAANFLGHAEGLSHLLEGREGTTIEIRRERHHEELKITTPLMFSMEKTVVFTRRPGLNFDSDSIDIRFRLVELGGDRLAVIVRHRLGLDYSTSRNTSLVGSQFASVFLGDKEKIAVRLMAELGEVREGLELDDARRMALEAEVSDLERKLEGARSHDRTLDRVGMGLTIPLGLTLLAGGVVSFYGAGSGEAEYDGKTLGIGLGISGAALGGLIGTEAIIGPKRRLPGMEARIKKLRNILHWHDLLHRER